MKFLNYLLEAVGYSWWISPDGKIRKIEGSGETSHVEYMAAHPEEFGYTKDSFLNVFKEFGEDFAKREGRAREFLIWKACESGWIRVRQYKNYWSMNVSELNFEKSKDLMKKWASKVEDDEIANMSDSITVNILGKYNKFQKDYDLKQINTNIKGLINKTLAPDPWKQGVKPITLNKHEVKWVKPEEDFPKEKEYKKPVKKVNPLRKRSVSYDFYESKLNKGKSLNS